MTDRFTEQLTADLHARARRAVPRPDLDAVLTATPRLQRSSHTSRRARRTRRPLAIAAVGLVLGGAWIANHYSDRNGPDLVTTVAPTNATACIVFLEPSTTDTAAEAIGRTLRARPGTFNHRYVDQRAAYAELKEQMADRPEVVASITPDLLPPSWRFSTTIDPVAAQAELTAELTDDAVFEITCAPPGTTPASPVTSNEPPVTSAGPLPTIRSTATGPTR